MLLLIILSKEEICTASVLSSNRRQSSGALRHAVTAAEPALPELAAGGDWRSDGVGRVGNVQEAPSSRQKKL